jgi:hypothetical protein
MRQHATRRSADARSLTGIYASAALPATITPILACVAAVRAGHTNGRSLRICGLDEPGFQRDGAGNEHLVVEIAVLIGAGGGIRAASEDR